MLIISSRLQQNRGKNATVKIKTKRNEISPNKSKSAATALAIFPAHPAFRIVHRRKLVNF
jgi:hypothetical protein